MGIVLFSCAGALMVIPNRPLGESCRRVNLALGFAGYGDWSYRAPLIVLGTLLACLSFLAD